MREINYYIGGVVKIKHIFNNIIRYRKFKKNNVDFKFKYINHISKSSNLGKYVAFVNRITIWSNVVMGDYSYCNDNVRIYSGKIGRFCSIAPDCIIGPEEHPMDNIFTHPIIYSERYGEKIGCDKYKKIDFEMGEGPIIEDNVWIGARCIILRNVCVGEGAIIAANSVVTKDVLPYTIVGGIPAKVIKNRKMEYSLKDVNLKNMTTDEIIESICNGTII